MRSDRRAIPDAIRRAVVAALSTPLVLALPAGAETAAKTPSSVTAGGVTLRSLAVDLPDSDRTFPGSGADAINNNCLACHSAGMVLTQPPLSRQAWQAEVDKMRTTYKAPVAAAEVPAIVDYLAALSGGR